MQTKVVRLRARAGTVIVHKARCEDCGTVRYYPTVYRADRWASAHSQGYKHTVNVDVHRIFGMIAR